MVPKMIIKT